MRTPPLSLLILVCLLLQPTGSSADCSIAADIAEQAYQAYQNNPENGVRLFGKAYSLCKADPAYAYNLGFAYLKYGRADLAVKYLTDAVAVTQRTVWLNNLGEAYFALKDYRRAREIAEQSQAVERNEHAAELRCLAATASGDVDLALRVAREEASHWPNTENIAEILAAARNSYVSHYWKLVERGRVDDALIGLKEATSFPQGALAYCLALEKAEQTWEALQVLQQAVREFPQYGELLQVEERLVLAHVKSIRKEFRNASAKEPVLKKAKQFAEVDYPGNLVASKAYEEMLAMYIKENVSVTSPSFGTSLVQNQATPSPVQPLLPVPGPDTQETLNGEDLQPPRGRDANPNAIAVIIGNKNYASAGRGIPDVLFADRDAKMMRQYLVSTMGFLPDNVFEMEDATLADFYEMFGAIDSRGNRSQARLEYLIRENESDLFIYYVGHGAPGPNGKSSFLVPVNAAIDAISATGYDTRHLYALGKDLKARNVTIVVDACFSGQLETGGLLLRDISPAMLISQSKLPNVDKTTIFAGAGTDQVATWYREKGHSTFTYFFLKGLGGAADSNQDRDITVGELETYLKKEVKYTAGRLKMRKQEPIVIGDDSFVLARLQ